MRLSNPNISPKFKISNRLEAEKIASLDFEKNLLEKFLAQINPGDTILDIGANIGLYTLPSALKTGKNGIVHSFEPVPLWFDRLKDNLELNGISNATIHNIGLSNTTGTHTMTMKNTQGSGMGSIVENYDSHIDENKREMLTIQLEQGDSFLDKQSILSPNVVKIDVEGAELMVIKGLENSLKNESCRFLMCEVHPAYLNEPPERVEELLAEYNFKCEKTNPRANEYHIFAWK